MAGDDERAFPDSDYNLKSFSSSRTRRVLREIIQRIPPLGWQHMPTVKSIFGWEDVSPRRTSPTAWLDGLRGVAALQVFFFHFWGRYTLWGHPYGAAPQDTWLHQTIFFRPIWAGGSGAVSTFFVISGCAITYKSFTLMRQRDYEGIFKGLCSSFFRRGFRLYLPIFLLAIFMVFIIQFCDLSDGYVYENEKYESVLRQFLDLFHSTDEHFNPFAYKDNGSRGGANRYSYVPTSWTIPMEYYGSLWCYLMVLAVSRVEAYYTRCGMLGFVALYSAHKGSWWTSNFMVGMLMADAMIERESTKATRNTTPRGRMIRQGIFVAAFCFGAYLQGVPPKLLPYDMAPVPRVGYEWLYKLYPNYFIFEFEEDIRWYWYWSGNLVTVGISQVPWLRAIFTTKFCQWLGKISFALYLVHALVISLFTKPLLAFLSEFSQSEYVVPWIIFIILTPIAVVLSVAVEKFLDQPSIKFARWLERLAFQPAQGTRPAFGAEARNGQEMASLIPPP